MKKSENQNLSTPQQDAQRPPALNIKSKVKAGRTSINHNETATRTRPLKVRTR